jgi:SAM-dependent methyltransferase
MADGTARALAALPGGIEHWPGEERRAPSISDPHYLVLKPLAATIAAEVERRFAGRRDLDVLDVGCGAKPYLPLVVDHAQGYRGLDLVPRLHVDDVGAATALPYPHASFDLVLCTQLLEHVLEPEQVVREIARVLVPGGLALVSTHGVALYHPDPPDDGGDYWRWTHSGLQQLFERAGAWREVTVVPNGNAVACVGYVLAQYVHAAGERAGLGPLTRGAVAVLNRVCETVDGRYPPRARVPAGGSLSANYLVSAVRGSG